jgi:serine/threonine protein kinase
VFFSPANILLQEKGSPLLTDPGLAHMLLMREQDEAIDVSESDKHLKDIARDYVSHPAYLAPEVVKGMPTDRRADIYSLGIILFELLSGQLPFSGRTYRETAQKHIREPLPSLHVIAPHIPISLELVINRALHRDPAHRFATAGELINTLTHAFNKQLHNPIYFSIGQTAEPTQTLPIHTFSGDRNLLAASGSPHNEKDETDITASPISTAFNIASEKNKADETTHVGPNTQPLAELAIPNDMDKMAQQIQQMRQRIRGAYNK